MGSIVSNLCLVNNTNTGWYCEIGDDNHFVYISPQMNHTWSNLTLSRPMRGMCVNPRGTNATHMEMEKLILLPTFSAAIAGSTNVYEIQYFIDKWGTTKEWTLSLPS
ncbi:TPA: hypothetical protein N0F65_001448 [Lagenidium giganteum]|uniref:Uncharacterized protein n=1 Tax=Lagenidium giganteum TaxID=4803 RepID=A0AAV2YXC0_9STRA|nr:TPA: hypothetical protein N0F65_001448 [Lagenidium giganteum]